jgi:hypothetical protein
MSYISPNFAIGYNQTLVSKIFYFMDSHSLCQAAKVCKLWYRISKDPLLNCSYVETSLETNETTHATDIRGKIFLRTGTNLPKKIDVGAHILESAKQVYNPHIFHHLISQILYQFSQLKEEQASVALQLSNYTPNYIPYSDPRTIKKILDAFLQSVTIEDQKPNLLIRGIKNVCSILKPRHTDWDVGYEESTLKIRDESFQIYTWLETPRNVAKVVEKIEQLTPENLDEFINKLKLENYPNNSLQINIPFDVILKLLDLKTTDTNI